MSFAALQEKIFKYILFSNPNLPATGHLFDLGYGFLKQTSYKSIMQCFIPIFKHLSIDVLKKEDFKIILLCISIV